MSLVQRLKGIGRNAALCGALASPVVYAPGCLPLAVVGGAVILADAERDAARINAQGRENAARVGNGGGSNSSTVQQTSRQNQFFACNYFKGDLNGNGGSDSWEFEGYNKTIFKRDEPIMIYCYLFNRKGALATFIFRNTDTLETIRHKQTIVTHDMCAWIYGKDDSELPFTNLSPGRYISRVVIGSEIIGQKEIQVIDGEIAKNN